MTTGIRQIEFLARAIVNRLEDRGLVEFGDAEVIIQIVAKTLEDSFASYDTIEQEARVRLARSHGDREPSQEEVEEQMRAIAAEKNFIL